jgi:hypothetical protein
MKNIFKSLACLCVFVSITSCLKDSCTQNQTYTQFVPVMMNVATLRTDVKTQQNFKLENPGKIYFYQNYLLINEQGKGIHFYDISNPSQPKEETFYVIPGNFDMAIKNNILIADDAVDLISIDISDVKNPKTISRTLYKPHILNNGTNSVVAYYENTKATRVLDCSNSANFGRFFTENNTIWANVLLDFSGDISNTAFKNGSTNFTNSIGTGGSFARMTIYDDYLYTVDNSKLDAFKINNGKLALRNSHQMGWGIETIFPYKDKLFIGSNAGMFIYDNSTPESPRYITKFEHARACDPVVVENNTAYVTLRNGTECNGFTNQLDVIDITSLTLPSLIKSYPMKHPHGLAVKNSIVYLCEGEHGFKTLDAKDASKIDEIGFDKTIKTYDVIALDDNRLLVIGADGFYQYDTSDPKKLKLLSKIPVSKN